MKARFRFLLFYTLFWLVFFQLARVAFLFYHWKSTEKLPFTDTLLTLLYGMKMDLSLTAYLLAPVCLFVLLSVWIPFFRKRIIYLAYTSIIAIILTVIISADLELYAQWGFRIDETPLRYLSSPREVWASISHLPLVWIGIALLITSILLVYFIRAFLKRIIVFTDERPGKILTSLAIAAVFPLLIIGIRGGLQLSPMNQSAVYFSKNNFANLAAINAGWNFMHGLTSGASHSGEEYAYFPPAEMQAVVDSLYGKQQKHEPWLQGRKPNIILLIWESFTSKAVDLKIGGVEVTPFFNQLRKEGLYFNNAYASGDRTDKGLSAILSGYPALNKTAVIRTPSKLPKLPYLSRLLKDLGYTSAFYYGGETEFANIKSYLFQGEFDRIVDKHVFPRKLQNSKWGAHDGVVFDQIVRDTSQFRSPFFLTWLTLTSHEPYEVPEGFTGINGKDATSRFLNSIHYTDKVVNDFVRFCKSQPWWNETVLVIVGDHGHVLPEGKPRFEDFHIPMLWLGGGLNKMGIEGRIVSQLDIGTTITTGFGLPPFSPFSRNLFDSSSSPWAFFTYNNAFGFIQDGCSFVFDNAGKTTVYSDSTCSPGTERAGKALQQHLHLDYTSR